MPKTVVLSLGGSVIAPDSINVSFLKQFKHTIQKYIKKGYRFVIVCGGGATARRYQAAAEKLGASQDALDWIGISATHQNAFLLRTLLHKYSHAQIVSNPTAKISFTKKILLAGGWKPGWSTDYVATLLAKKFKATTLINMSNVDFVYEKDPRKYPTARKLKTITWAAFKKMVGSTWKAGLNAPFDPIAAREAAKQKLNVIIIGKQLKNFEHVLQEKQFRGTTIY